MFKILKNSENSCESDPFTDCGKFAVLKDCDRKYDEISSAVAQVDSQDTSILVTKGYALDNLNEIPLWPKLVQS